MPQTVRFEGQVADIFFHRFVLVSGQQRVLADVGPRSAETIGLQTGDRVVIEGEQKPSEIKVSVLTRDGTAHQIDWPGPKPGSHGKETPLRLTSDEAVAIAKRQGFEIMGSPLRGPKHFDVLGRRAGAFAELHIGENGEVRKVRPVTPDDPKWHEAIKAL